MWRTESTWLHTEAEEQTLSLLRTQTAPFMASWTGLGLWAGSALEAPSPFSHPSSYLKQDLLLGLANPVPKKLVAQWFSTLAAYQNHTKSHVQLKIPAPPPHSDSVCDHSCTHCRGSSRGGRWRPWGPAVPFLAAEPSSMLSLRLDSPSPGSRWWIDQTWHTKWSKNVNIGSRCCFVGTIDREFANFFDKYLVDTYLLGARHACRLKGYNSGENRHFRKRSRRNEKREMKEGAYKIAVYFLGRKRAGNWATEWQFQFLQRLAYRGGALVVSRGSGGS